MNFEFQTAASIIFGPGSLAQVVERAKTYGSCAFVLSGKRPEVAEKLVSDLEAEGVRSCVYRVENEPTTDIAREAVGKARSFGSDMVIGIGGGSVLDTAKVAAALLTNRGDLFEYLEVIGEAKPLTEASVPCIAIPTTAGTGTEVTRNAVLSSPKHRVKVSVRSPFMLPRLAVVDPELSYSAPPELSANSGLDALTQLIEVFVSLTATPFTNGICREGLLRAARSIERVCENGTDIAAREDMAFAALSSGIGLGNAKLGAVHGFAGPLGGMYNVPHGAICAALLPHVMGVNAKVLKRQGTDSGSVKKFDEVACLLTGTASAKAADGVRWLRTLCDSLGVVPLEELGVRRGDFEEIAAKARKASSMRGNPVELSEDELLEILDSAY